MSFKLTEYHCVYCGHNEVWRDDVVEMSSTSQYYCLRCGNTFRAAKQELSPYHKVVLAAALEQAKASWFYTYNVRITEMGVDENGEPIIKSKRHEFNPRDIMIPDKTACDNCKHHTIPPGFVHMVRCLKFKTDKRSKDRCVYYEPQGIQTD